MINKKAFQVFIIMDLIVILFCIFMGQKDWLLNTQVAFFSSLFVTIGSYFGYKNNIQNRVKTHINDDDNYDEIDKMDDKYDLYSEEIQENNEKTFTSEEIKTAINPIKQNYLLNFKSGFSGMISFYRLFGYIFLIIGFFYLNNNHYLHIYSYILGFLIVPFSSLLYCIILKNN
jgi:hypothetical protein